MTGLERLPVSVSETELHDIDTPESFEASGRFLVAISNHGRDAHVHLNLDDDLAGVARVEETNVYVGRDATREVEVVVDPEVDNATGSLTVETGYGAKKETVRVTVGAPESEAVAVDDTLGHPPSHDVEEDGGEDPEPVELGVALPSGSLSVGILAVLALALAVATIVLVGDLVVVAGVVVVLIGVLAAAVILLR